MITRPQHIQHPGDEPLRLPALAMVLQAAATTARRKWHPERYDVYHCARGAWRAQAMPVPFAAVTRQLRQVVPDGLGLLEFNDVDGRTRADVAALFTTAHDQVRRLVAEPVAEQPQNRIAYRPAAPAQQAALFDLPVGA